MDVIELAGTGGGPRSVALSPKGSNVSDLIVGTPECDLGGTNGGCVELFGLAGSQITCAPSSITVNVTGEGNNAFWLATKVYLTGMEPTLGSGWFFGLDLGPTDFLALTLLPIGAPPFSGTLANGTASSTIPVPCPAGITVDTRLFQFDSSTLAFKSVTPPAAEAPKRETF